MTAPKRIWAFDRYVNGILMAEGVEITKATSLPEACAKAAKIASLGPHGEPPVLVHICKLPPTLSAALALPEVAALVEAVKEARNGLEWAQHHLGDSGTQSVSINHGLQGIIAALAVLEGRK